MNMANGRDLLKNTYIYPAVYAPAFALRFKDVAQKIDNTILSTA